MDGASTSGSDNASVLTARKGSSRNPRCVTRKPLALSSQEPDALALTLNRRVVMMPQALQAEILRDVIPV